MNKISYLSYQEELVRLRRHFHTWPEVSMEEKETAKYVFEYMKDLDLEPQMIGENGVVVMVWAPEEIRDTCHTVAVRSEMDALFVQETNEVPWKSKKEGVMHACGHDGIVAAGLVLAKICARYQKDLPVNVKFIFQPAEENGQGTQMMLDAGVMENPHVDEFVMYHYVNDAPLGIELHRGASTAAIGSVILKIRGKSVHWCSAQHGRDAIRAGAKIVEAACEINESYQGKGPFIVGIGMFQGGTAKNVVAQEAVLSGTLRACYLEDYEKLRALFQEKLAGIEQETGTRIEAEIDEEPIPPIINDDELVDLGLLTGKEIWGEDCRLVTQLYLSGDSAAYYFHRAKGIFMVFTAEKPKEKNCPLHNGRFDFSEEVLWKSVETLHQFILNIKSV